MARVAFEGVSKRYGDGTCAVENLDIEVGDGEFMVLVGPSGCGKTTALRMVAGLEEISRGHIRVGERVVDDVSPRDRDIAMVFQNYALYPHLSVEANIGFALKMQKRSKKEIRAKVDEAARMLDLQQLLKRKPAALSGGQRQRVAMGRAIVREPQAFLMDEPLSNLDAKLRVQMRADIKRIQSSLGVTTIYVTHDQVEAMTMGDRVAVLRKGQLQQVAAPEELYDHPNNAFVAGFIGSPAMNMLEADVGRVDGSLIVTFGEARLTATDQVLAAHPRLPNYEGRSIVVGIRPESIKEGPPIAGLGQLHMRGEVELREALGAEVLVYFAIAGRRAVTDDVRELAEEIGDDRLVARAGAATDHTTTLVGRFDPKSNAREGQSIQVAIDGSAIHLFDPGSGAAL